MPGAPMRRAARVTWVMRSAVPGWVASMSGALALPAFSPVERLRAVRKRPAANGS